MMSKNKKINPTKMKVVRQKHKHKILKNKIMKQILNSNQVQWQLTV